MSPVKKQNKKKHKNNSAISLLTLFVIVAVIIITLLEYIDYKNGKHSFIFTKIIILDNTGRLISSFNKNLFAQLKEQNISYEYFRDDKKKCHFKVNLDKERSLSFLGQIKELCVRMAGKLFLVEIQKLNNRTVYLYHIKIKKFTSHFILISVMDKKASQSAPKEPAKLGKKSEIRSKRKVLPGLSSPKIAFVIDDLGNREDVSSELKNLNVPITASILPYTMYAREESQKIRSYGLEQLIHIPMQSKNSGYQYPDDEFITINSTDEDMERILSRALLAIPYARGVNNHMGSLITSNREIMVRFLKILQRHKLFFIDSRTSSETVAYDIALSMGIKTAYREVFLDHKQDYYYSLNQIKKLVTLAKSNGSAIAIGHPFDSTIEAIRDSIAFIKNNGISIVFVKDLLN